MQIIVLGPHRSGTSLLTRLINMMGAYFGVGAASIGFNQENPKGFWERRDVIDVNDEILLKKGCAWDQLVSWKLEDLPTKKSFRDLDEIDHKIKNVLLELDANRPWVTKDPRLCLTYPYWKRHLEVPVIVSMTRDPIEVALSLKTRNGFPLHHGLAIWEYYALGTVSAMRSGVPVIHVTHQEILSNPYQAVKTILQKLQDAGVDGLRLPKQEEVEAFIEPSLYHSKAGALKAEELLTPFQLELKDMLEGKKEPPKEGILQPSEMARQAMEFRRIQLKDEEKLLEANKSIAGLNQRLNELSSDVEFTRTRLRETEANLEKRQKEVEKLDRFITDIQRSTSWKIGNGIARFLRAVTFSRPPREKPKSSAPIL